MFLENKYTKWYYSIICNAKSRDLVGYVEKHHIVPASLGGSNSKDNLVRLTAKEHFLCHMLLVKMVESSQKSSMIFAAWRMTHSNNHQPRYTINSNTYSKPYLLVFLLAFSSFFLSNFAILLSLRQVNIVKTN